MLLVLAVSPTVPVGMIMISFALIIATTTSMDIARGNTQTLKDVCSMIYALCLIVTGIWLVESPWFS